MLRLLTSMALVISLGRDCAVADMGHPNGCAEFHNEYQMDRGASDVYIGVRKADDEGACFLVPRSVTDLLVRKYYVDAGLIDIVGFEPLDLRQYLQGKSEVLVGEQQRKVPKEIGRCLDAPSPEVIQVLSGPPDKPNRVDRFDANVTELESDMPGFLRFREEGWPADYYIAQDQSRELQSFECGPYEGKEVCPLNGGYDGMKIRVAYWKADMSQVDLEVALQCVRLIGELFRIK
jgi:hypothetical protein